MQHNQDQNRYRDYIKAKEARDAASREELAQSIYKAGNVATNDQGMPAPDIPQGQSYGDLMAATPQSPDIFRGTLPSGNQNAATEADVPEPTIGSKTAEIAAALARAGDVTGAAQILGHDIARANEPTLDQFMNAPFANVGGEIKGKVRGLGEVTRKGPPEPKALTRNDYENWKVDHPNGTFSTFKKDMADIEHKSARDYPAPEKPVRDTAFDERVSLIKNELRIPQATALKDLTPDQSSAFLDRLSDTDPVDAKIRAKIRENARNAASGAGAGGETPRVHLVYDPTTKKLTSPPKK